MRLSESLPQLVFRPSYVLLHISAMSCQCGTVWLAQWNLLETIT